MTTFVTVSDVDTLLGTGWNGTADKDRAVLEANTYLSGLSFKTWETQPEEVTRAGAELAKLSADGELYADSQAGVKRKRVKAGEVESELEFAEGGSSISGAMAFIQDMLRPFLANSGSVQMLRRL